MGNVSYWVLSDGLDIALKEHLTLPFHLSCCQWTDSVIVCLSLCRAVNYLKECAATRVIAISGFFLSIPTFLAGRFTF